MHNLSPKQFTFQAKEKAPGGWSGSVTPLGATSAAHARAMVEQSGTHEVTDAENKSEG